MFQNFDVIFKMACYASIPNLKSFGSMVEDLFAAEVLEFSSELYEKWADGQLVALEHGCHYISR